MTLEERMTCLEQANRRRRVTVAGLAALIGLGFVAGMTAAAPDEITLRKLSIVDGSGTTRIVLDATSPNGMAATVHYDKDGKPRIATNTISDGVAATVHSDKDRKRTVEIGVDTDGTGMISVHDPTGRENSSQLAATPR